MKTKSLSKSFFITTLIFLIGFSSCSQSKGKNQEKKAVNSSSHNITVGFSIDTLAIERWQRDLDIFINKVKELGADIIVQNAGNSIEEQNRQLLYLMERNVDIIVVLPKDANSISDTIQKIKNKGIPVISYDRLTLNADIDLYLTINSEKVGEYMATGLLRKTHEKKWFAILGAEEDYNMTLILQGLNKILRTTNISIAHTFYTDGWNYDLSYEEMVRLINEGNIPDAIVCGNDAIAESVIQALTRYYPDVHIPICGQDADIAACQNIINETQDFTIYKPITELAELTAECAVKIAKKEELQSDKYEIKYINNGYKDVPVIWLPPVLVNKNNINKVIVESGFHTANSIYGTHKKTN